MRLLARTGALFALSLVTIIGRGRAQDTRPALNLRDQRQRQEAWFQHGRRTQSQSPALLRKRAYAQKMQMRASRRITASRVSGQISGSIWTSLGPAPLASDASGDGHQDYGWVTGRATAVAIDPADPTGNTLYVGGAYGGVWKSTNAAAQIAANVNWVPLTDDQATLAVGAIAIQPQLPNPDPTKSVVLVGTGEANLSTDSYYGLGILRSADAGTTWTIIQTDSTGTRSFAGMAFSKIAFSTVSPNLVVAGTTDTQEGKLEAINAALAANLGIYYSTNGGVSWSFSNIQDAGVTIAPDSVTSVTYNAAAGQFFATVRHHGFYSSSDGINWTRLANQPGTGLASANCPTQSGSPSCPINRGEISVVPGRNEMYVWYVDENDADQGIWESMNGGFSWTQINDSAITLCGDNFGCGTEDGSYNLQLAAVPDGGATDLYAGAANLFKCQITSASPTCTGTAPNTFLNLTHAYGCSSIAEVHPAQHSIAYLLLNNSTQDLMYFANDGGLYRALDGYGGLTSGSCGSSNAFDNLNQTIGSLTQLFAFSEAAADPNVVLAGTPGDGAAATQSGLASSSWLSVDAGSVGYVAINPDNSDEWFVSGPGNTESAVNIFRCTSGVNCHSQDFENNPVVSSATLGGDAGASYPPFVLDPQNSADLIVGTCRIWRGASSGSGFVALSNSFETGGAGICTGSEVNLVNTIAAGGPVDSQGLSTVMYAGTDGDGPLTPTIPSGGHVWVSTNASAGPSTWTDQTGSINPDSYPISGIAIDSSDTTGLTAYVTVMGFGVPHVWKTTNGGSSWTDFTGNLPDSPANAVLVDPGSNSLAGTIYVGTDVGVFSSLTSSPDWSEVGPAPDGAQTGYLPNVAVTMLRMYNTGNDKFLRASTYGRGLWQFPLITTPDYTLSISNTPLTIFAGSSAAFGGFAYSLDAYSKPVTLSCVAGITPPPSTCSVSPGSVTPSSNGTPFTIAAASPDGTYEFNLSGTDSNSLTHSAAVTLNVVDFNLAAPSVNSVTLGPASTSSPISLQVTAAGPFAQSVSLSCSGLPSGALCNFEPSSLVSPTAAQPVTVTLTISTASNTAPGTYSVQIVASTSNGPTKTQSLSFTVTAGYALAISNPSLSAYENATATFEGTLTSLNGYGSPVNLSCGNNAPPTCTIAPAQVVPTDSGASFTVTVSSNQCGEYSFNIIAQGTDKYSVAHSSAVIFTSTSLASPDFVMQIENPSLTAALNAASTFNGTLTSTACYDSVVNLSCGTGAPPTCSASPASVKPGLNGTPFSVTVNSDKVGTYNFSIVAQGTDPSSIQHLTVVSFITTPSAGFSFTVVGSPTSESVKAGETATYQVELSPSSKTFPSPVSLSFSGCPPLSTCSLSQTTIAEGKGAVAITLTVESAGPVISASHLRRLRTIVYATLLWFPALLMIPKKRISRPRTFRRYLCLTFGAMSVLVALMSISSCGGGLQGGTSAVTQPGTPTGTYNLTVAATITALPGSPTKTADLSLTIQ